MTISKILSLCLLILGITSLQAQCPTNMDLRFTSQKQIDDFKADYPNCTNFDGSITIEIRTVQGPAGPGIPMQAVVNITNFSGFTNLESISALSISGGGDDLNIDNRGPLTLNRFQNLKSIGQFTLRNMPEVLDLNLPSLETVDELVIENVEKVQTLLTANQPIQVTESLRVLDNPLAIDFGDIQLMEMMTSVIVEKNGIEAEAFDILLPVRLLDELTIQSAFIDDINSDFDITVNRILRLANNERLSSITGISVGESLGILSLISNNQVVEGWEELLNLRRIEESLNLDDMNDISYVANLEHIEAMRLVNMPDVANLNQFSSLQTLGSLSILNLTALTDLTQLSTVNFFGLVLDKINTGIEDVNDIQIKLDSMSRVSLGSNPSLVDITNLASLIQIGELNIWSNEALTSLEGLA